jgi:hypothetical protein
VTALSLLALPTAWEAGRVDAEKARKVGEYSGLPSGQKRSLVPARAGCGTTATPREGGEARAGVVTNEGGGTLEGESPSSSERGVELHA